MKILKSVNWVNLSLLLTEIDILFKQKEIKNKINLINLNLKIGVFKENVKTNAAQRMTLQMMKLKEILKFWHMKLLN